MRFMLYARKSTDEDDRQLLSIDAQLREVREFATREKLTVVREFVESRTAKEIGRPIFGDMMNAIESGEAEGILAWHPDRLARNSVDGGRIIYLLDIGKLFALKFPSFWFENTPQGKFMLNIAFGQSKYYVDNLSENIRRGIREKLTRGEFPGRPPVGYLNHPRLRTIVVDDAKAPLVRRLFEVYAEGTHTYQEMSDLSFAWGLRNHADHRIQWNKIPDILAHWASPDLMDKGAIVGEKGSHGDQAIR
jgi:site-specific DNA recombinase